MRKVLVRLAGAALVAGGVYMCCKLLIFDSVNYASSTSASASSSTSATNITISPSSSMCIKAAEIDHYVANARNRDASSINSLELHYSICDYNEDESDRWLAIGARFGTPDMKIAFFDRCIGALHLSHQECEIRIVDALRREQMDDRIE